MEVTSLFAGAGLLLLLVGGIASLAWLGTAAVNTDSCRPGSWSCSSPLPVLVARPDLAAAAAPLRRVRYSSLSLVRDAAPRSSRIRRHLPFALFVLAVGSLVIAMARPVDIVSVPAGQTTVILAMDVSRSMCATDIPPNRLLAAERGRGLVHRAPGLDHPDRHRRVRRVRRDRPVADDRPGGPARRRREPRRPAAGPRSAARSCGRSTRSPRSTRTSRPARPRTIRPRRRPSRSPTAPTPRRSSCS